MRRRGKPDDGSNVGSPRGMERQSSVASMASTVSNQTSRGRQSRMRGAGQRLRQAAHRARGGKSGTAVADLALKVQQEGTKEQSGRDGDDIDKRMRWELEMERAKQIQMKLNQLERINADLSGRLQSIQLKHDAELSELRQEIIALHARIEEMKEMIKVRDATVREQAKIISTLRTGMNMSRVQLAYNFVALHSNIDIEVAPEEIFTSLVPGAEPGAHLQGGVFAGSPRLRSEYSGPYLSPAKGKVRLTVLRPSRPTEWRHLKLRILKLLAGVCRCDVGDLTLSERAVDNQGRPIPDVTALTVLGESPQQAHQQRVVLEMATRTGPEAAECFRTLQQNVQVDGELKMIEGLPLYEMTCWRPEPHTDQLTPAGRELLRLNTELLDFETANGRAAKAGKRETNWEKERREQLERDKAFELSRAQASAVAIGDLPEEQLFPHIPLAVKATAPRIPRPPPREWFRPG
eukprot:TRINITY_DN65934_c0_g1_i1.p1 TRINITY_DN65934_c0_g1~~TRINITY_DN65934_c0_g1_i1.p1  ORF type:complete len:463 (+),score=154.76 TRINITY_DN65934_c0_g1_i1:86-1474(+)